MQIGNNQTQSYGYNQNVNVANKNDSSNSFNKGTSKNQSIFIKIENILKITDDVYFAIKQ